MILAGKNTVLWAAIWIAVVVSAASLVAPAGAQVSDDSKPNIVFVYTDDQAPTAVGIENDQLRTPNMDRLFGEGARLVNSFVTTPVCSPSRASLMTGRYASELGIYDWINPNREPDLGLDPNTVTWPELLSAAGYRTGLVGKWHLGTADRFHPTRMGFDYFMGFRSGGNRPKNPTLEIDGQSRRFDGFTPDILTDHAIEFVCDNQQRPFLLCLHFRAPHAAWLPVAEQDWAPYRTLDPRIPNPEFPNLDVAKIKRMTREYYASVASVDRNLGRLLKMLDDLQLTPNTVVIFTSDHGYNLGHHGVWYKGNAQWQLTQLPRARWPHIGAKQRPNLFDQSLRVPTAVRWPKEIKPGTVVTQTVSNLDWFPTILEMTQTPEPPDLTIRGRSILPLLRGEEVAWQNDLYAEYSMKHGAQTHMRAWRTPQWKLMIDFKNPGRMELYHLANDPSEQVNLANSTAPQHQQIKKQLRERIQAQMRRLGGPEAGGRRLEEEEEED